MKNCSNQINIVGYEDMEKCSSQITSHHTTMALYWYKHVLAHFTVVFMKK